MTSAIRDEMNIRDTLLRRARRMRLESDWLILRAKRKEVKRMIRNSEIEFVQNRISECHGKPGAMWKIIRNYAPTSIESVCIYSPIH